MLHFNGDHKMYFIVKRFLLIAVFIFLVAFFVGLEDMTTIPPERLTKTRMTLLKQRILKFRAKNGKMPLSLKVLPLVQGKDNETVDGWGGEFLYLLSSEDSCRFTSLGADRKKGGNGLDVDIVVEIDE